MVVESQTAKQTTIVLLVLFLIIGLFYLLFTLAAKLGGVVLFLVGLWLIIFFPAQQEHQPATFTEAAKIIGLVLVIVGVIIAFVG